MTLFFAPEVLPFGIAACAVIALALVDGIGIFCNEPITVDR